MISTSGELTYNEWVQGSKIVYFTMLAPCEWNTYKQLENPLIYKTKQFMLPNVFI